MTETTINDQLKNVEILEIVPFENEEPNFHNDLLNYCENNECIKFEYNSIPVQIGSVRDYLVWLRCEYQLYLGEYVLDIEFFERILGKSAEFSRTACNEYVSENKVKKKKPKEVIMQFVQNSPQLNLLILNKIHVLVENDLNLLLQNSLFDCGMNRKQRNISSGNE